MRKRNMAIIISQKLRDIHYYNDTKEFNEYRKRIGFPKEEKLQEPLKINLSEMILLKIKQILYYLFKNN